MKRTHLMFTLVLALGAVAIYGASSLMTADAVEEEVVTEVSQSISVSRWGEGDAYSPAPPDLYQGLPAATGRPSFISDVVVHESLSEAVGLRTTSIMQHGRGMGMGTLRSEHGDVSPLDVPQDFQLNSDEEFRLDSDEEFAPFLLFSTHSSTETYFLIMALVDYQQVEFTLDGMIGLLHEVRMPPGTTMVMPFSLGTLPPGAHDVEIVIFDDPYAGYDLTIEKPSNESPMNESPLSDVLGVLSISRREFVIVDDNDQPARLLQARYSGASPPADVSLGMLASFAGPGATHPTKPESQIAVDVGEVGGEYHFRTWTTRHEGYGSGEQAIMLFVDFHLVPVNGNDLLMVELEVGEEAIIDSVVMLPDEPGVHQMLAFVILDPYSPRQEGRFSHLHSDTSRAKLAINAR